MLRGPLQEIVDGLLATTPRGGEIALDALGEAIGVAAVTAQDIDDVLTALERAGRTVASAPPASGAERLRVVLASARELRVELGRAPNAREVAARAGLGEDAVRHALALARVMQR